MTTSGATTNPVGGRGNVEVSNVGLKLKTMVATDCHHEWSTGYISSKANYSYGFFEATMKIADSLASFGRSEATRA
jgi:hypothetical protein